MKKCVTFIFLIAFIGQSYLFSQAIRRSQVGQRKINLYLKKADELFSEGQYYAAAEFYGKVVIEQPDNEYVDYRLAESNRLGRYYRFAELWYKDVNDTTQYPLTLYWLGQMRKANENYRSARQAFKAFNKFYTKDDYYKQRAKEEISICQRALKMMNHPKRYKIQVLGEEVNTVKSDFAAIEKSDDTLYYSSNTSLVYHKVKLFGLPLTPKDTITVTRLYRAPRKEGTYFQSERQPLDISVKEKNVNIGSSVFGVDSNVLYFTVCPGQYGKTKCNIYKARRDSQRWQTPQLLSKAINDPESSSKTPFVYQNQEGDTILLFSSNRQGGDGDYDLWYSQKENGKFATPQNLGSVVNTPVDEITPFYQPDKNQLFFSSKGHSGLGQFDIYKTKGKPGSQQWSEAQNLGYPVNSGKDDYYFTQYKKEEKVYGFFSSNRKESGELQTTQGTRKKLTTCCDDIFHYRKQLLDSLHFMVYGDIINTVIEKPMDSVEMRLFAGDNRQYIFRKRNEEDYSIKLDFTEADSFTLRLNKKGFHTKQVPLTKKRLQKLSDSLRLTGKDNPYKIRKDIPMERSTLPNLYYSFKSEKLNRDNRMRLDYITDVISDSAYQEKEMIIASHTDNIDSRSANRELSKKRSEIAHDYLVDKGIDSARLVKYWYGESKPVAPNQKADGRDNPGGRAKNRRTEFTLTDTVQKTLQQTLEATAKVTDTFSSPENPNNIDPDKQQNIFKLMLEKYGDKTHKDLKFKVQVGAYTDPGPTLLTQILFSLNVPQVTELETEQTDFGVTRFLVGQDFKKLRKAEQIRKNIVQEGEAKEGIVIKDSFIAPYYKGKRILMTDAFEVLAQDEQPPNISDNQHSD